MVKKDSHPNLIKLNTFCKIRMRLPFKINPYTRLIFLILKTKSSILNEPSCGFAGYLLMGLHTLSYSTLKTNRSCFSADVILLENIEFQILNMSIDFN